MIEGLNIKDAFAEAKEHEFYETERERAIMNFTERFQNALAECAENKLNTVAAVRMLALLKIHGPNKMTYFVDALNISSAAITGLVDRLAAMGLIERRDVPLDRRAYHLALTDKGRELLDKILP